MPIYEYYCSYCKNKSSIFTRMVPASLDAKCSICGSTDMIKLVSSFAYHKSIQNIHEESGEPMLHSGPDYYKDPRNIGRWAEKRFKEMGMDMPEEIQQKIQAAREGVLPEPLKDLQSASPDASYH